MTEPLVSALAEMKEEEALKIAKTMLGEGKDPLDILELCRAGMEIVGQRFEKGEYFLPELMMAGEILSEISEIVKPKLSRQADSKSLGKVVIGTVAGDIHDIGKNIIVFLLRVNGFEVVDLGVDVPPQKFVESISEVQPQVVGLSGFLTLAFDSMKNTVDAIKKAGLRDGVKIMIGGGQINEQIREFAGADAYGKDAMAGVSLTRTWTGSR